MTRTANFETRQSDGYERWRSWNRKDGDVYCYVHQLVAIAYGADPYAIFSDGRYHVHHRNGVHFDNRPRNIEFVDESTHARTHNKRRASADG